MRAKPIYECCNCGVPLFTAEGWFAGLCYACYEKLEQSGILADYLEVYNYNDPDQFATVEGWDETYNDSTEL